MAEPCILAILEVTEVLALVAAAGIAVLSVSADASPNSCVHRESLRSWNGKAVSSDWSCATLHAGRVQGMSYWKELVMNLIGR